MRPSWAEIEKGSAMQGKFNSRVIDGTLVHISSALDNLLCTGFIQLGLGRWDLMYCRAGQMLLDMVLPEHKSNLINSVLSVGMEMESIGTSRTKCLVSTCQPPLTVPRNLHTHRRTLMNTFTLVSLRSPIVKKPVYQLNTFTLKKALFFSWTY